MTLKSVIVPEFLEGSGRSLAERRLIQLAASLASHSDSDIAAAILNYYNGAFLDVSDFQLSGDSFSGLIAGNRVAINPDGSVYSGTSYIGRIEFTD